MSREDALWLWDDWTRMPGDTGLCGLISKSTGPKSSNVPALLLRQLLQKKKKTVIAISARMTALADAAITAGPFVTLTVTPTEGAEDIGAGKAEVGGRLLVGGIWLLVTGMTAVNEAGPPSFRFLGIYRQHSHRDQLWGMETRTGYHRRPLSRLEGFDFRPPGRLTGRRR